MLFLTLLQGNGTFYCKVKRYRFMGVLLYESVNKQALKNGSLHK